LVDGRKQSKYTRYLRLLVPTLSLITASLATLSVVGYLYGATILYTVPHLTAIAFQTATFILAVSLGLVLSIPERGMLRLLAAEGSAGILTRRILPAAVGVPLILGLLRVAGDRAGLFDSVFGSALRTVVEIALFVILLWWTAKAISRNAEQRKQVEDALRQTEARLTAVLRQLPVGLGVMDLDGRWTLSNAIMDEFVPKAIPSVLPERTARWHAYDKHGHQILPENWPGQRALRGEVTPGLEMIFTADNGTDRWTRVSAAPLRDDAHRIIGAIAVVQDITDQKVAEQALRASENRLAGLINSAMDAVIVVNAEQRIVLFNPAAEQMFGCVSSDVVGSSLDRFIPQHHRSVHRTHIKDFGKTGTTTRRMGALGALSAVRSNGAEFPIEASISQLETDGEKLFTVILRDISERKLAEAESEKAFAREQELREAEEEANRLKDEFLAIMSHELRNPLNVILGYSELFLLSEEIKQSPQLRRMAEALKRNALTQSRLIRDLLDLSRLRSGKISLSMEAVSLLTTIKNAVETVSSDADAKAIRIEVTAPKELLFVNGDPVRLEQVIWNLVNNSVKFTPAGGKIKVSLARQNGQVLLTVEDTGQGIDSSFLPHVFELFRQADAGTSRAQSGMGIGLAVVWQLVDLHQGSISAFSAGRGKGASFTVQLPLTLEPKIQLSAASDVATSLDKFSVLVVDDSEDTTEMLARLLTMSGAIVTAATSGEDGLRIIAENEFDAVISDISMPGMDGFEFLRRLRQLPNCSNIPVLALTGFGRPEDIQRAQAAGFYSHVTKPFEFEALVDVLQKLPKRRSNGRS
jgi:PAS domain S-box-containing protein